MWERSSAATVIASGSVGDHKPRIARNTWLRGPTALPWLLAHLNRIGSSDRVSERLLGGDKPRILQRRATRDAARGEWSPSAISRKARRDWAEIGGLVARVHKQCYVRQ